MSRLLERVTDRRPFAGEGGRTGAAFERGLLPDGTAVVLKHVTCDDWLPRSLGTTDLLYRMWTSGIFARVPPSIDHLTLSVEPEGDGHVVVMRDASDAMFGDHRVLSRDENTRVLHALDDLHAEFWGEHPEGLVTLVDHYAWITPKWIARFESDRSPVWGPIRRGWELFGDVAPGDITDAMRALIDEPQMLASELSKQPTTLIHGDARLHNMGLADDRLVLIDWEVCGLGPPAVDIAWYLIISASRIDATREAVLEDYRNIAGDRFDERALELALIGALMRLGWNKAIDIVENPDPSVRAQERADLDWWVARVRRALEVWSPV